MTRDIRVRTGEQPANLALTAFERYHRELRRFLLRRGSQSQDAGDLMQEVYVRILSLDRATLVRNPQAYMYGIAAHVAREFRLRSQRNRVRYDSETIEALAERPAQDWTDELTEGVGLERQVEQALMRLSPNHLKVLVADRRDGLTNEQIAQKLGLSMHTVKKYLVQALTQVRESWHETGNGPGSG